MKDVFDYLEEEDLLRNLPEALPQMEDETAILIGKDFLL